MNLETLTVKLTADLSGLKAGMNQATALVSGLTENIKKSTSNIGKQFSNVGKSIFNELKKTFKQLTAAIALTAFANEIRKVMVATDGWKEKVLGVKDKWNELIQNMSELLMPLIERMIPVIEKVLSYLSNVATKIGNYFGIKLSSSLKKTLTQAEKVKATIAGFDDLNVLNNNSESTSFISEDVEALEDIYDTFENSGFAKQFSDAFSDLKEALNKIDWNKIKDLATELGKLALNGLVTAINLIAGALDLLTPILNPLVEILTDVVEAINKYIKDKNDKKNEPITSTRLDTAYEENQYKFYNKDEVKELEYKIEGAEIQGKTGKAERLSNQLEYVKQANDTIAKANAILDLGYSMSMPAKDLLAAREAAKGYYQTEAQIENINRIYNAIKELIEVEETKKTYALVVEQQIADATYNYDSKYGKMVGSIRGVR